MKLVLGEISQKDLDYSITCLAVCRQDSAEQYGFCHPYFAPGGHYGKQWWQLDSALALRGYQWIDRAFVETSLLNFIESQREDGRICLWGADVLPGKVAGENFPQQTHNVSSLPKLFDVAYHILQGSSDESLKTATYNMLKKYLDWWFINRQDPATGLITAVFEETFIPYLGSAGEYAPVDTNTEVYVGCHYTEILARELGKVKDAEELSLRKEHLKHSINQHLWNEEKGAYYPYLIRETKHSDCLMASTFFPLRLGIAPVERRKRLIALLTDHELFNWDRIPLTSVSKLDAAFTTTKGDYQGNASWSGNVWTLINEMIVRGLEDCNENELAAELAMKTLVAFRQNCTEFINPFDGSGHGVIQYAWTASQYIELIVETIFGIRYDAVNATVTVTPKLTEKLKNRYLALTDLRLTEDVTLDVTVDHGTVSCRVSNASISIII